MTDENIARLTHELNRELSGGVQPPWHEAPERMRDDSRRMVQHVMFNPNASPKDDHNRWCEDKLKQGWKHGPVKDEKLKTHPALVPYEALPFEERVKNAALPALVRMLLREET